MYKIQITQHAFYTKIAKQQYHVTLTQRHPRGNIMDRTGNNYLAMNHDYASAFILPTQMVHPTETKKFLKQHFPSAYQRLKKNNKHFLFIKRRLSVQEQALITHSKPHDIFILSEPGRYYPITSAGPIIGLTNIDNKGLLGIELLYNHVLAGNPTICHLEKDARSGHYYFKKKMTAKGDLGKSIQLTIDADLQFLTQEKVGNAVKKFNAKQGSAIIINPKNGEIVAMVSFPHFDPNNTHSASTELCKNSTITDAYELGSVIKVCAALAALEENVVTADELIDCKNTTTTFIDGRKINTVKSHGIIPFTDVIAFSNNIGIATVAKKLGKKLYDHYKRLGFGTKTGIPFPGESSGFVNPPEKWSKQSIISLSYGYEISATILQLACAFCTIATGYHVTPTLLMKIPSANDSTIHPLPTDSPSNEISHHTTKKLYSDENLEIIKNILERTTLHGTARRAAIKGYRVMSKTGTANMLIDGKYDSEKNLFSCAGIIEKGDYQRVIVTFIKQAEQKNLYAATVAVPLFEEIAECMLIHDKIIS